MKTKDYKPQRRGGFSRGVLLVLFALFVLMLLYLLLPFGSQRAVLLGSDARAGEGSRSDTLMVAKAGGGLLAVPRDTLIQIPGTGEDKINAAFANGGPPLAVETLENFMGLPIGNYVGLNFGGTKEIVDALGGISVNVEEPIETEQDGEYFSIPAGPQELNGAEAGLRTLPGGTHGGHRACRTPAALPSSSGRGGRLAGELPPPAGHGQGRLAQRGDQHEPPRGGPVRGTVGDLGKRQRGDLPRHPAVHKRRLLLGPGHRGGTKGGRDDRRVTEPIVNICRINTH